MTAISLPQDWRSLLRRIMAMSLRSPLAARRQLASPLGIGLAAAASGPTTLISDAFTDVDNTLLTAHTIAPINTLSAVWLLSSVDSCKISGNKIAFTILTSGAGINNLEAGVSDCTLEIDFDYTASVNRFYGIMARFVFWYQNWLIGFYNGSLIIYEVNTSYTMRASTPGLVDGTTYTLSVALLGNVITASTAAGAITATYTSALYNTATQHGIYLSTANSVLVTGDNFKVITP